MSHSEFVSPVAVMRESQKAYFKTRDPYVLGESKKLEKAVDKAVKEFREPQGMLFGGGDA